MIKGKDQEALKGLGGPMTRAKTEKAKEALQQVLATTLEVRVNLEDVQPKLVNCLMANEEKGCVMEAESS